MSREEAILKSDLMAHLWTAHAALCECIDAIAAPAAQRHDAAFQLACNSYKEALIAIRDFAENIVLVQGKLLHTSPPEWERSLGSKNARFWIKAYGDLSEAFTAVIARELPSYPDEALLTAFEELPDRP